MEGPEMARTKKTDQEKNAGKTATDAAKEAEKVEQVQETAPELETAEQVQEAAPEPEAAEQVQEAAPEPEAAEQDEEAGPDMFANLPNPCVYCGPSVKGVARQYTTYQGGIPDALRNFIKDHPGALGLIVSTGTFPAMRKRLETYGTKEAELYKAVKAEL